MLPVELCQFCHERVDPENDRFVVVPDADVPLSPDASRGSPSFTKVTDQPPRRVAHTECYQVHLESLRQHRLD